MKKEYLLNIIKTPAFYVPSPFIFIGVTVLYAYEFYSNSSQTNFLDTTIYWLIYAAISVFLQFVIFVQAKRQYLKK